MLKIVDLPTLANNRLRIYRPKPVSPLSHGAVTEGRVLPLRKGMDLEKAARSLLGLKDGDPKPPAFHWLKQQFPEMGITEQGINAHRLSHYLVRNHHDTVIVVRDWGSLSPLNPLTDAITSRLLPEEDALEEIPARFFDVKQLAVAYRYFLEVEKKRRPEAQQALKAIVDQLEFNDREKATIYHRTAQVLYPGRRDLQTTFLAGCNGYC